MRLEIDLELSPIFHIYEIFIIKNNIMARITKLTEADLNRLVKKVIKEDEEFSPKWNVTNRPEKEKSFDEYRSELGRHLETLKQTYNDLINISMEAADNDSLSEEEKDEIESAIEASLDDPYGMFLQD
jgi:hypothetical protein